MSPAATEGGQGRPEKEECCNANSHSHETQLLPCSGKLIGMAWKEGIIGVLGRFLLPEEQSWGKGQPQPCQALPRGSWVPQIRQAPNVSSCWAGKMILNNSPINRQQRGGTEQEGLCGPVPPGGSQGRFPV